MPWLQWDVRPNADGTYTITIGGNPTGVFNGRLVTILQDAPPTRWILEEYPSRGPDVFMFVCP